jgi:replicative DNA helicase
LQTLEPLAERLCFIRPPFDLANVAASADAYGAGLVVLDYVQRIKPPGNHNDKRGSVDAMMDYLRQFADAGVAVIVVAAVSRSKDSKGRSSYDGENLSLASFRESSELEFGADDAFILVKDPDDLETGVILRHLKARHTEAKDIALTFDRPRQRFTPRTSTPPPNGKLQSALAEMWARTAADTEEEGGDESHRARLPSAKNCLRCCRMKRRNARPANRARRSRQKDAFAKLTRSPTFP